jgi:peptidoglycan hydrolase-like protein with peptidoglycan-binding domain
MGKAGGLVLILSGLAVAVYGIAEPADFGEQTDVAKSTFTERPASRPILVSEARPAFRPRASAESVSRFSPQVVVTVAPRTSELLAPPQRLAIPKDRDTLAREIQKELRRVGCYDGEVNGAWSPSTRRAMKAFIERVNASLPVEEPDAILYAMVQGQRDQVCGKACPAGEVLSVDGRCESAAILAKTNRKVTPAPAAVASPKGNLALAEKPPTVITGWSSTTTAAAEVPTVTGVPSKPAPPPIEGRMALTGPTADPVPATETAVPRSRPTRSAAPTAPPRAIAGEQRWSRAIFSPRNSNN